MEFQKCPRASAADWKTSDVTFRHRIHPRKTDKAA